MNPASLPLQGTGVVVQKTSEATGSLSRLSDSVEATAKYISLDPAHSQKGLHYSVRVSPAQIYGSPAHSCRPRAGFGTRGKTVVGKGSHRAYTSRQRNQFLQLIFYRSKEGWGGLPAILDLLYLNQSVMQLKFKMLTLRQIGSQIRSED